MARVGLANVFHYLGRMVGRTTTGDETDELLLERFTLHHDESAFAALVQRHGPMVLGVCRRVLNHTHDAEDAFQAVFLVLARKSASIRNRESLDSWLYGVAYRIAVKAKANAARRRAHERQAAKMLQVDPDDEVLWRELSPILDAELNRLPEKYRAPLVLCYLKGKTNEQAALQLGWTKGTVSGRLARARELLRSRLARRGLVLSAGVLATLLAQKTAAAMPATLATSTAQAAMLFTGEQAVAGTVLSAQAVSLAEEALKDMWLVRAKTAAAVVLVLLLSGFGLGAFAYDRIATAWANGRSEEAAPVLHGGGGCGAGSGWKVQASMEQLAAPVFCLAFAPDDRTLASGGGDKIVRLWDTAWDRPPVNLRGHQGPVYALAFAPRGSLLASASADHTIRLWDPVTHRQQAVIQAHSGPVYAVAFAPDDKTLASGGTDHEVKLWDAASGQERATLHGHTGPVYALAFSRDGKTLISGSGDHSVKIWDVATGQVRATLSGHSGKVWSVALSPDGLTVASGSADHTIRLWDVGTGQQRAVLRGHLRSVRCVAFTSDGRSLLSVGGDPIVRPWDSATGQEQPPMQGHTDGINAVACTWKGGVAASGGLDQTIRIYREKQPDNGH